MCQMADIVLPETHFLERSGYAHRGNHALWPQLMLKDGIEPLWDGKGWSSIVSGILKAMGKAEFDVDWKAFNNACLDAAETSTKAMKANEGIWEKKKEPEGMTEFKTPTKKIELYSTILEKEGHDPLPSWHEPFDKPSEKFPYRLLTHHLPWQANAKLTNDPYLLELQPENLLHLHPEIAGNISVQEGEYVMVDSPTGKSLKIKAHVTKGIRKDCLMTEHHYGHWSKGLSIACGMGANDGELLPERHLKDTLKMKAYLPCFSSYTTDVCVNVRKA
jgi:thiosulfate reductase/polysulfide reductase chain A